MSIIQVLEEPSEAQTLAMQEALQTPGVCIFFLFFFFIVFFELWYLLLRMSRWLVTLSSWRDWFGSDAFCRWVVRGCLLEWHPKHLGFRNLARCFSLSMDHPLGFTRKITWKQYMVWNKCFSWNYFFIILFIVSGFHIAWRGGGNSFSLKYLSQCFPYDYAFLFFCTRWKSWKNANFCCSDICY